MQIPLIDLKAQYASIKNEIDVAIMDVLDSAQYIMGHNVGELEKEVADFCGVRYAISVASGTDALILTLNAFGISVGSEVITTPYTFFSTAEAISRVGATPVFVDIDPYTYNIDPPKIERKITHKTKAIIPVHLFGQMADMEAINNLAKKYGLIVIEDACQAIGAVHKGEKAGSLGDAGCFSFFPTKNLGCVGDGGIVTTNNEVIAQEIRRLRTHGSTQKYIHEVLGYNSRLDELQAAILRVKLRYLENWNNSRREKASIYSQLLMNRAVQLPYIEPANESVFHLYVIQHKNRDLAIKKFTDMGIGSGVYYPVPLHLQDVYRGLGYCKGDFPVAENLAKTSLALPLYPEITFNQQEMVVSQL